MTYHFIETIDNSQDYRIRMYLDLKKGLKLHKILKENPQGEFRRYWLSFAQSFRDKLSYDCSACLDNEVCSQGSFEACQCYITFGFGDNIIRKIEQEYLNKDLSPLSSDVVQAEWERLGAMVTFWCCGSSHMSTISASS